MLRRASFGLSSWSLCLLAAGPVFAEVRDLKLGGGARHLEQPAAATPTATRAKPLTPAEKVPTHRRGPKPKVPLATLPEDVPLPPASERARRAIALGPTREQLAEPASPELSELRAAERVLFPEPLPGLEAGWSFSLPVAAEPRDGALGMPPQAPQRRDVDVSPEDAAWLRSLTMPDLPVVLDPRVVTYLKFYRDSPRGRTIASIWA